MGAVRITEHRESNINSHSLGSTANVILDESRKGELLEDIGEFRDITSQQWYSYHAIPYRRGYLLYEPPGTGNFLFLDGCRVGIGKEGGVSTRDICR